jgi:hypothetical protein
LHLSVNGSHIPHHRKRLLQAAAVLMMLHSSAVLAVTNFVTTTPLREQAASASYQLSVSDCQLLDALRQGILGQ